jgi:hypothetical protein
LDTGVRLLKIGVSVLTLSSSSVLELLPLPLFIGRELTAGAAAASDSYRSSIIIYCYGFTVTTPDGLFAAATMANTEVKTKKERV